MDEKGKNKQSYKRQKIESIYNHYKIMLSDNEFLLIGVEKNLPKDELKNWLTIPHINCSDLFWQKFLNLSLPNRAVIMNTMIKYSEKNDLQNTKFNTYNWNVFTDFLFHRYNMTLYDIAIEIEGTGSIKNNLNKKTTFDRLDKLQYIKTKPRLESLILAMTICSYYLFSFDLITTGVGKLYSLRSKNGSIDYKEQLANYTYFNIKKEIENLNGEVPDLKQLILKLTGLNEADIFCVPIIIFESKSKLNLDKETQQILWMIMEEMEKSK